MSPAKLLRESMRRALAINQEMTRYKLIASTLLLAGSIGVGWLILSSDPATPSKEIAANWQAEGSSEKRAIVPGYSDFNGYFVDADIAAAIYGYLWSETSNSKEVLAILQKQLPQHVLIAESPEDFVFRQTTPGGINEYRILLDAKRRRITVLSVDLDSPAESRAYPFLVEKLRKIHRE